MKKNRLGLHFPALVLTLCQMQLAHGEDIPVSKTPIADAIEEVVITAQRKSENSQKAAVSLSILRGDELAEKGLTSMAEMLQAVPGVVVQEPRPEAPVIAIRGLNTYGPSRTSSTGSTAIYIDGILVTQTAAQFYDINRVEVLRGPQGTLYGRGATGGAVNFITNEPETGKFSGSVAAEAGSYNLRHFTGVLNTPISDTVAARLSFNKTNRDGYLSNGQDDENSENYRLKVLVKPNKDFSLSMGAEHAGASGVGAGTVALNADKGVSGRDAFVPSFVDARFGSADRNFDRFYANLNMDVGIGTLTYIPAYQNFKETNNQIRFDHVEARTTPMDKWLTNEVRLANKPGGNLSWVTGLYFADRDSETNTFMTFFPGGTGTFFEHNKMTTRAVFGEATYAFAADVRGTIGLRSTKDSIDHVGFEELNFPFLPAPTHDPANFAQEYSHRDYKIRVEKDLGPASLVYASVSTGYRPGGYASGTGTAVTGYAPEVNTAYEIGTKNRFLNNRLQMNGSIFYYDYSGFQTVVQYLDSFGISRASTVAQAAKLQGGELELAWRPTTKDKIIATAAYLNARNADGSQIIAAPKWTLTGDYSHSFELSNGGSLAAGADVRYVSDLYVAPYGSGPMDLSQAAAFQKGYSLVDLRLTYSDPDDRFSVSGYVKNATDKLVKTGVQSGPVLLASVNAPRTAGVVLNVRF